MHCGGTKWEKKTEIIPGSNKSIKNCYYGSHIEKAISFSPSIAWYSTRKIRQTKQTQLERSNSTRKIRNLIFQFNWSMWYVWFRIYHYASKVNTYVSAMVWLFEEKMTFVTACIHGIQLLYSLSILHFASQKMSQYC